MILLSDKYFVIADVKLVFPWSICPIVPTLMWAFSLEYLQNDLLVNEIDLKKLFNPYLGNRVNMFVRIINFFIKYLYFEK
jgi:hypothetical protein